MREENVTIAIIGGNEPKTTIKRLFEEYNGDDCIIVELENSELRERCIVMGEDLISELEKYWIAIETPLIPELSKCCKVVKNLETPEKFMNISKKKQGDPKKSVLGKHYTQPYISTRYYWRGNIK